VSGKLAANTVAGTDTATATGWLLPAATVKGEAGDVVAPAGNPASVTATEPANPPWAVTDTVKELEAPAFTVSAAGESTMLKSGRGSTVRGRLAECVSPAKVPLAVRGKLPAATVAAMERVTAWLPPAGTMNGEAGEVVTPAGNPESVTATESLNPF
jgi:hypothetical protein